MVQPIWKQSVSFSNGKQRNLTGSLLLYDPEILLLGKFPKGKYMPHKNLSMNMHSSIIHNSQKVKITQNI